MNARRHVIAHIRSTFTLPKKPFKSVFHLPDVMLPSEKEIPPLEHFMVPEPDVESRDDSCERSCESVENVSVLGSYRPMCSPGLITLHTKNLTQFFCRLTLEIDKSLPGIDWTKEDLNALADWTVDKTFWHERFHHSMDVLRHILNLQTFDPFWEEALAVAFSRYFLTEKAYGYRYRRNNSPQAVIWDEFIKQAYQYRSPGYRDWVYFSDPTALKSGICDYLTPKQIQLLKSARIPVADMLFAWLPVAGGFEEQVV